MVVSLLNKMLIMNQNKKSSAAKIENLQRQKFKELIGYAMDHSPFYADYYRRHGIKKEHIGSLKITDLPLTNKKILMDNFDKVVCDPRLKLDEIQKYVTQPENLLKTFPGGYTVLHSSGTSGKVGYFIHSKDEWEYPFSLTASRMDSPFRNFIKRANMICVVATNGNYAGVSMLASAPGYLYNKLFIPVNLPMPEIIARINTFPKADIITGYAAGVYQLAKLQLSGQINERPRLITTSAEMLTTAMRNVITEAFKVNPRNFYAASESLCMGGECEFHSGLHLFTDCHIFELVDEQKQPVPAGVSGNLVVTNLYKKTQPLIRYEINDVMSLEETPCACGSPFPRVKNFGGREAVVLEFLKDDRKGFIHHSLLKELAVPGLQNIQYIQNSHESLVVNAVITGNQQEGLQNIAHSMDLILKNSGLDFVKYSLNLVEQIPVNPKTQKLETVVRYKPASGNYSR